MNRGSDREFITGPPKMKMMFNREQQLHAERPYFSVHVRFEVQKLNSKFCKTKEIRMIKKDPFSIQTIICLGCTIFGFSKGRAWQPTERITWAKAETFGSCSSNFNKYAGRSCSERLLYFIMLVSWGKNASPLTTWHEGREAAVCTSLCPFQAHQTQFPAAGPSDVLR